MEVAFQYDSLDSLTVLEGMMTQCYKIGFRIVEPCIFCNGLPKKYLLGLYMRMDLPNSFSFQSVMKNAY
jgi:hypothetical protein